jgi:hypothetical protein
VAGGAAATGRDLLQPGNRLLMGAYRGMFYAGTGATAALVGSKVLSAALYHPTPATVALAAAQSAALGISAWGHGTVAQKAGELGLGAARYQIGGMSAGKVATYSVAAYLALQLASKYMGVTAQQDDLRNQEQAGTHQR